MSPIENEQKLETFLDEREAQLEELWTSRNLAEWDKYLGQASAEQLNEREAAIADFLLDPELSETITTWHNKLTEDKKHPILRRLVRWGHLLIDAQARHRPEIYRLRTEIDTQIVTFRPTLEGQTISRTEQRHILRTDPDRERRKAAWLADAPLAQSIAEDTRELMRRRNRIAQELGYSDYVALSLTTDETERSFILETFLELEETTHDIYKNVLDRCRRVIGTKDLRPWDIPYALEKLTGFPDELFPRDRLIDEVTAVLQNLGFRKAQLQIPVTFIDIPFGGLCFAIRPPDDVRILANPRDGHTYYVTMFHEFGHALHARHIPADLSPILKYEPGCFNEGMACAIGRLAADPEWLAERDLSTVAIQRFRRSWAAIMIHRLRSMMALATFEYRAYEDLDQDLDALWREIHESFLLVPYDINPGWAASPFWVSHPVYYQNYVLAEVIASQILTNIRGRFRALYNDRRVGPFIARRYFQPACTLPWLQKIRRVTGHPLSTKALINDLVRYPVELHDWESTL